MNKFDSLKRLSTRISRFTATSVVNEYSVVKVLARLIYLSTAQTPHVAVYVCVTHARKRYSVHPSHQRPNLHEHYIYRSVDL